MWILDKNHSVSFRKAASSTLAVLVVPLFIVMILFNWYTIYQQQVTVRENRLSTLGVYQARWEDTLTMLDDYLADTVANDSDFSDFAYARTETGAFLASLRLDANARTLLRAYELLGAFFLYSNTFDYYRLIYTDSYPLEDLDLLRNLVIQAGKEDTISYTWEWVRLSDRTVLLFMYNFHGNLVAAMMDPVLLDLSGLGEEGEIFFSMPGGEPYCSAAALGEESLPPVQSGGTVEWKLSTGERYELTSLNLSRDMGSICFAAPTKTVFQELSAVQFLLLAITFVLLACIPVSWLTLRRLLLEPVDSLTSTMEAIQGGDTSIRVPQTSRISEVNQISQTVNTMLDTIQQQKIDAYEQRLATQHAQLQYLHLQIRPHFFLNCLNIIYSLAGEKKYQSIQELALNLSVYLRHIFKDGSKLVPLETELTSVENYIRIQQAGAQIPPQLKVIIDADTPKVMVPPLSLLTFVENSVKHSNRQDSPLEIRIKCSRLAGEEEGTGFLYVTISDNGGGFTEDQLKELNSPGEDIYTDRHVGIANIRSRLHLLFGSQATLSFRNLIDGACVELFLPINSEKDEGELG